MKIYVNHLYNNAFSLFSFFLSFIKIGLVFIPPFFFFSFILYQVNIKSIDNPPPLSFIYLVKTCVNQDHP